MRHTRPTMGFAFALAAAVSVGANAAPLVAERVTFDSLDRDATGLPVRLTALRYLSEGAATARGAVIALHGCGGIQIFIGESDDWTPAAPCAKLSEAMAARALPVAVKIYPGTYHDFDAPGARMRVRHDVPNGANPGKGVTTGGNSAARDDAYAQVKAILRANIGDGARLSAQDGN